MKRTFGITESLGTNCLLAEVYAYKERTVLVMTWFANYIAIGTMDLLYRCHAIYIFFHKQTATSIG